MLILDMGCRVGINLFMDRRLRHPKPERKYTGEFQFVMGGDNFAEAMGFRIHRPPGST